MHWTSISSKMPALKKCISTYLLAIAIVKIALAQATIARETYTEKFFLLPARASTMGEWNIS